jgi:hypothetical protein
MAKAAKKKTPVRARVAVAAKKPALQAITATPRFQRLDAKGRVTQSDKYVGVLDTTTNLIWSRATHSCGRVSYAKAMEIAAKADVCGKPGRLPTRAELASLVDDTRSSPAIDPIFDCNSNFYWSSTPLASSPSGFAWLVGFLSGSVGWYSQDFECFVRAVRVAVSN